MVRRLPLLSTCSLPSTPARTVFQNWYDLFEKTAHVERFEHLAEEAELAGLIGSDADNLSEAIDGESYEVETMYKEFAEQAAADGDHAAASRFAEVRGDEIGHRDAFKAALIKLNQGSKR